MSQSLKDILIFSQDSGRAFAEKVTSHLGVSVSAHEERIFDDSEYKIRPLDEVRGKHTCIIQSLYTDSNLSVNDKLVRLLFFIGVLKESGARRVSVIIPYLCFARKDRKTKHQDPVTTKYLALLMESVGLDHIITMDVHNLQAYQNSFRCQSDHLKAKKVLVEYIFRQYKNDAIAVLSPDAGGMKRAEEVRELLEEKLRKPIDLIFMEKSRSNDLVKGKQIVGDVKNKTIVIIDDLISTGTTLSRASNACLELGSLRVIAAVTHGVFGKKSVDKLKNSSLEKIIITNTLALLPSNEKLVKEKIVVLDISIIIADFIKEKLILQ